MPGTSKDNCVHHEVATGLCMHIVTITKFCSPIWVSLKYDQVHMIDKCIVSLYQSDQYVGIINLEILIPLSMSWTILP